MIADHMRESMNPKNNEEGANTKAALHSSDAPNMPAHPRVAPGETNIPVIGIGIKRSTRREREFMIIIIKTTQNCFVDMADE